MTTHHFGERPTSPQPEERHQSLETEKSLNDNLHAAIHALIAKLPASDFHGNMKIVHEWDSKGRPFGGWKVVLNMLMEERNRSALVGAPDKEFSEFILALEAYIKFQEQKVKDQRSWTIHKKSSELVQLEAYLAEIEEIATS